MGLPCHRAWRRRVFPAGRYNLPMPRAVERISGAGCGSGYDLLPGLENVVDGFNGTRRDAWYVIDHYVPKAQKALFYRHNSQNLPSWVPPMGIETAGNQPDGGYKS
jgi:hypothetical protein